jgi:clan AA aspartic protease (TIGR02281 family)
MPAIRLLSRIRIGVLVLLMSTVCLSLPGWAGATESVAPVAPDYQAGVQAYRGGDYAAAAEYLRHALMQDPRNLNAHYYLALVLDNLGQGKDAVPEYRFITENGHESRIVDYARERLAVLQPVRNRLRSADLAMMASGSTVGSTVYRGSVSQISIPIKNSKNALMLDAGLRNGRHEAAGAFILDTGATYTSISQELADQLGLDLDHSETVRITTANGRIEVPKVMLETLSVGGLEAHNVEVTVIPVRSGSQFSGLLGLSFIRQFVLTIDPQAGQLVFRKN